MKQGSLVVALAISLAACGGSDDTPPVDNPHLVGQVTVTGVGAGTNYSYDIGQVSGSTYYYTDRNNQSVDAIDIPTLKLTAQITGIGANAFAGLKPSNANSGPDGLNAVGALLFAGDVYSVKVIDPATRQVTKTIVTGNEGVRSDEGCYDATHGIYMISTPEAATPHATFINAATQTIVATVTFTDSTGAPSAGLEACSYDATSDTFFVNNDGTTANPHGELDALPGASIRAIAVGATVNYTTLAGVRLSGEGNCDPTGLALGPGTDIAIGCREGTTAAPLLVQIMNRSTGAIVASLTQAAATSSSTTPPAIATTTPAAGGPLRATPRWTERAARHRPARRSSRSSTPRRVRCSRGFRRATTLTRLLSIPTRARSSCPSRRQPRQPVA